VIAHSVRLRDLKNEKQSIEVSKEELKRAYESLPREQKNALNRMAGRIRSFAKAQRDSLRDLTTKIPGGKAGHVVRAVRTAGCYAPGGRYPLPSSVLMTAITARVAGVENVWVASPRPAVATMAAAHLAGVDGFLRIGGAQAIACFAYGVGPVPPADVIVGPGNRWVTAAKQLVSGRVGIDMLAGPSECLVIADRTASPDVIAADLLAQAEHDTDARPILIASGDGASRLVSDVNASLAKQLKTLPTASTAREALVRAGFAVITNNINEAIRVTDMIAPEHLEVMTKDSDEISMKLSCYGGLFVGTQSAEVMGDYGAGPNHVLPTGGTGRYTGGLSVFTFLAIRTWMRLDENDEDGISEVVSDAVTVARMEGLEGHARAASFRLPSSKRRRMNSSL
jgi:histidinol dehydrogenase